MLRRAGNWPHIRSCIASSVSISLIAASKWLAPQHNASWSRSRSPASIAIAHADSSLADWLLNVSKTSPRFHAARLPWSADAPSEQRRYQTPLLARNIDRAQALALRSAEVRPTPSHRLSHLGLRRCGSMLLATASLACFAPPGRLGFLRCAEPAPATALIHFNSCVKSLVLHVINPLAVAVHIALDRTLRRGAPSVAAVLSSMACALTGTLKAPRITVLLFR